MSRPPPSPAPATDDLLLAASLIDLTSLDPTDTPDRVQALCAQALAPGSALPPVAAVCVWPTLIADACATLRGTPVRVATVAGGFPAGQVPLDVKVLETRLALEAGAEEIDLVINRGPLLQGRHGSVAEEVGAVRAAMQEPGDRHRLLKVILETGELASPDLIRSAADAAIRGGADFLKTSTGKSAVGATTESVRTLLAVVREEFRRSGRVIGIKISGGVRTPEQAIQYLGLVRADLGADARPWLQPMGLRFGASGLLDAIAARLADAPAPADSGSAVY